MAATLKNNKQRSKPLMVALTCLCVQATLAPHIHLAAATLNAALIYLCLLTSTGQPPFVVIYSFGVGLLYDFMTTGTIGLMAFVFTLVGLAIALMGNSFGQETGSTMVFSATLILMCNLIYHIMRLIIVQEGSLFDALIMRAAPGFILDMLGYVVLYVLFERLGSLLGRGGRRARGSHLSTKGL